MNIFLNLVGKKINELRKNLPDGIDHVVEFRKREKSYAAIWFKTRGCRHSYEGGCTMCDYFISNPVQEDNMYQAFLKGLNELPEEPDLMVVQTSGSFFDTLEVPESVRVKIYQAILEELSKTVLVFETHIETINEEIIQQLLEYFPAERVQVEIGVETSDEWVRKYCVNKWISNEEIKKAVQILRKYHVAVLANVVIGIPFLSLSENIKSASDTITWAIQQGITSICLFPVNIKPYTLVYWLYQHNLYSQPSLWALVDVIVNTRGFYLSRVDTNWYRRNAKMDNPYYETSILGPYTCSYCNDKVVELLDQYNLNATKRMENVEKLKQIKCNCREEYYRELENVDKLPLSLRVKEYYDILGKKLMGENFWNMHRFKYLNFNDVGE